MLLRKIMPILVLALSAITSKAQTTKPAEKCNDECCKDAKKPGETSKVKNVVSMETVTKKKAIACKLTSPDLRKRKEEVIASLKSKVLQKQELSDGYKYKFAGTDSVIDEVVTFIKTERLCCDFFAFSFSVEDDHLWLSITGPQGAKEFIKAELDL